MTIIKSLLTIQLVIYSLLLGIVKFDLSVVAKILIFQLVNFAYFKSKWLFKWWKKNSLNSKSRKHDLF